MKGNVFRRLIILIFLLSSFRLSIAAVLGESSGRGLLGRASESDNITDSSATESNNNTHSTEYLEGLLRHYQEEDHKMQNLYFRSRCYLLYLNHIFHPRGAAGLMNP